MQHLSVYRCSQYLLSASILLYTIQNSHGLKCVQCHSLHHDEVCDDPFDMADFEASLGDFNETITEHSRKATEIGLVTCEPGVARCMKTVTVRKGVSKETHVVETLLKFVSRECGDSGNKDQCDVYDSGNLKSTICSCLGDQCNGFKMTSPLSALYVILSLFYVINVFG